MNMLAGKKAKTVFKLILLLLICGAVLYGLAIGSLRYYIANNSVQTRLRKQTHVDSSFFTSSQFDTVKIYRRPLDHTVIPPDYDAVNKRITLDDNESLMVFYRGDAVCDVFAYPLDIVLVTKDDQTIQYVQLSKDEFRFEVQVQERMISLVLTCETPENAILLNN